MTPSTSPGTDPVAVEQATRRVLELRLDADAFWLSPLRAMVNDAALRAGFDLEAAADLTMAVDEAMAVLIDEATSGERITAEIELTAARLRACVTLPGARDFRTDTFSWQVLRTLADSADVVAGGTGIQLVKERIRPDG